MCIIYIYKTLSFYNKTISLVSTSSQIFVFPQGGVIDARYELRVPTHLELKSWGRSLARVTGELWQTLDFPKMGGNNQGLL